MGRQPFGEFVASSGANEVGVEPAAVIVDITHHIVIVRLGFDVVQIRDRLGRTRERGICCHVLDKSSANVNATAVAEALKVFLAGLQHLTDDTHNANKFGSSKVVGAAATPSDVSVSPLLEPCRPLQNALCMTERAGEGIGRSDCNNRHGRRQRFKVDVATP
nr:hypothetical protein [Micromonospora deserti]